MLTRILSQEGLRGHPISWQRASYLCKELTVKCTIGHFFETWATPVVLALCTFESGTVVLAPRVCIGIATRCEVVACTALAVCCTLGRVTFGSGVQGTLTAFCVSAFALTIGALITRLTLSAVCCLKKVVARRTGTLAALCHHRRYCSNFFQFRSPLHYLTGVWGRRPLPHRHLGRHKAQ